MTRKASAQRTRSVHNSGQLIMSPAGVGLLIQRQLRHPPLLGALSSVDGGHIARVRMVVIRHFDMRDLTLQISADRRSAKVRQLSAYHKSELCLWLPELSTQLRLALSWRVITAGVARRSAPDLIILQQLWRHHKVESRHLFGHAQPGRAVSMRHDRDTPHEPAANAPPANFAVLLGRILAIDALVLSKPQHVRYRHRRIADHWETLKINP
ncbi:MAG: hypothetical protein M0Z50_14855 [Planctomycetia bacterium]|nr:hypothetical protein [Planctomycetia bacterium]